MPCCRASRPSQFIAHLVPTAGVLMASRVSAFMGAAASLSAAVQCSQGPEDKMQTCSWNAALLPGQQQWSPHGLLRYQADRTTHVDLVEPIAVSPRSQQQDSRPTKRPRLRIKQPPPGESQSTLSLEPVAKEVTSVPPARSADDLCLVRVL